MPRIAGDFETCFDHVLRRRRVNKVLRWEKYLEDMSELVLMVWSCTGNPRDHNKNKPSHILNTPAHGEMPVVLHMIHNTL
jgi:hypothetical protein